MNYNSNTFVISTGEHLAAIAFSAPWVNGKPMNHGQACMLFAAVHEEVFNEMFAWANIDNTVQKALTMIYNGSAIMETAKAKLWAHRGTNWVLVDDSYLSNARQLIDIPLGGRLPAIPESRTVYRVQGGQHYVSWLVNFVNVTLNNVACHLRNEINRYLGSMKDYEWWFEYSGNGVVYSRQDKATIKYANPLELVTEADHINFEVGLMPRIAQKTEQTLVINADAHEAEGPAAERHLNELLGKVPDMLMQFYNMLIQVGRNQGDVVIKYRSVEVLKYVEQVIRQVNASLPVRFNLISEKQQEHQIIVQHSFDSLQRNLQRRSVEAVNQQQEQVITTLIEVRNRIVKRNKVSELDQREIQSVAPDVFKQTYLNDNLHQSISDSTQWYKFNGVNPTELTNPVIILSLLLSDYVDSLTGNNGGVQRMPIYDGSKPADVALSAIPLYTN